jgi:hypothetical protein
MTKSNPSSTAIKPTTLRTAYQSPPPLFVVPRALTDHLLTRPEPKKRPGRKPDPMTKERQRRAHIKSQLKARHPGSKLDQHIQKLRQRLGLLEEIRIERDSVTWGGDIEQSSRQCGHGATQD